MNETASIFQRSNLEEETSFVQDELRSLWKRCSVRGIGWDTFLTAVVEDLTVKIMMNRSVAPEAVRLLLDTYLILGDSDQ